MSISDFREVWHNSRAKSLAVFVVHLAIADRAVEGEILCVQTEIAKAARCHLGTVNRAILELVDLGHIEVIKAKAGSRAATVRLLPSRTALPAPGALDVAIRPTATDDPVTPPIRGAVEESKVLTLEPDTEQPLAVSAPDPIVEPGVADLMALLRALKIEPPEDAPAYWYRAEHTADYRALLKALNLGPAGVLALVEHFNVAVSELRSIKELRPLLGLRD